MTPTDEDVREIAVEISEGDWQHEDELTALIAAALLAERERAEAAERVRDEMEMAWIRTGQLRDQAEARAEAAEKREAALREALTHIRDDLVDDWEVCKIARAALEAKP